MSSRRYPVAEAYDERQSDFYRSGGRRSGQEYEELDVDIRRGKDLDFLNDDYGRAPTAGQLVVRERPAREERSVRARSVDQHRRRAEKEDIDVIVRRDEGSVRSALRRAPPPPPPRERAREVERDEVIVDHREVRKGGRVVSHEDDITIRRDDRGRVPRSDDRESIHVSHRSMSRPRYDSVPPPPRPRSREMEEIIIDRRRARSRSYSSSRRRLSFAEQSKGSLHHCLHHEYQPLSQRFYSQF